jgi:hypothetical protein
VQHIVAENEATEFLGMLGSIDGMHWEWSACSVAYHGAYRGHKGKPALILEAVASKSLRVWHVFFGMLGSHNDINVIQRSPVFDDLAHGRTVPIRLKVNDHDYNRDYYVADKIYPGWATIVKMMSQPINVKDQTFATAQECTRKDVERVFRVLRSKFRIIQNSCRFWNAKDMNTIMRACIILHNMILEDVVVIDVYEFEEPNDPPISMNCDIPQIHQIMKKYEEIMDRPTSRTLQADLVEQNRYLKGAGLGPYRRC